jgi:hypothetical protein
MYFSAPPYVPHAPQSPYYCMWWYKSRSSLFYISLQSAETSTLLGPNILSPCFSLNVKDRVSHQYKAAGTI